MRPSFSYYHRLLTATSLLSVALIAYQVSIIQLLSYVQWYHFANMVISVALLGFGAAGTILSLFRKKLMAHSHFVLPLCMILCGLMMVVAAWLSRSGFARFDSWLLFTDRSQWISLFINYILFFLPFFFGALALGIIFVKHVAAISQFYFFNLLGSGIGAMLIAALTWYFFPASLPMVIALIAIAAGLLLLPEQKKFLLLLASFTIAVAVYRILKPVNLTLSAYKSISRTLNLPSARIILEKTSPYGFVQVAAADALRYAPGLSLAFTGEVPVKKAVFNNGEWYGPVVSWKKEDSVHLLDYTTMVLPYTLHHRNNVLVLHSGTGLAVSHALSHGAVAIDAVEPHQAVNHLLVHELAHENDSLFYHSGIKLHSTEPRTFISATAHQYDLVQLPAVGSFGGGAGLYAMREEYILTKEAFAQMWSLLKDDGAISITAWMDYPFRNPLKTAATLAEAADAAGISASSHIIAIRNWATITFILKKTPLSSTDTMLTRRLCDSLYFDPVIMPGLRKEERTVFNGMNDPSFFQYLDEIFAGKREMFYRDYDFYLRPATDDKPYFSQFLRLKSLPRLTAIFGTQSVPFLELGWLISIVTFLQLSVLALVLIVLPLLKRGWKGRFRFRTFFYFSGLGIGYMFLEIVLIQRFILFFGNPVYAAALVIGIMMLASGAGSYFSSALQLKRITLQRLLSLIIVILTLYSFLLSTFLQAITAFPTVVKLFVSLIIISLPSFLMGTPFPMGLKLISTVEEKNIPWAWAINGCMSVISASLAALLAAELGFSYVMSLAAIAYCVSLLAINSRRIFS